MGNGNGRSHAQITGIISNNARASSEAEAVLLLLLLLTKQRNRRSTLQDLCNRDENSSQRGGEQF